VLAPGFQEIAILLSFLSLIRSKQLWGQVTERESNFRAFLGTFGRNIDTVLMPS